MEVKPGYKQTEVGVIPEDWDVADTWAMFKANQRMALMHLQYLSIHACQRYLRDNRYYRKRAIRFETDKVSV